MMTRRPAATSLSEGTEPMVVSIEPQPRTETVNGIRLYYLDWDNEEAQPVLLLDGFSAKNRA